MAQKKERRLSVGKIVYNAANGGSNLVKRLVVTTSWDDGGIFDLKLGELLTKYGIKGTFYIPKLHHRVTPLTRDDILALAAYHEVGSHTINHPHLTTIPKSQIKNEVEDSKSYLEDILGKKIRMFCYPYGEYNEATKTAVKDCGFLGARTIKFNGLKGIEDPYEFGVTVLAANGNPFSYLEMLQYSRVISLRFLLDWEARTKIMFDLALAKGGIWHLWGHSWEIEKLNGWNKLDRVLNHVSKREGVLYLSNGETLKS